MKRLHINRIIDIKYDTIDYIACKWLGISKIAVTKPTSNNTKTTHPYSYSDLVLKVF